MYSERRKPSAPDESKATTEGFAEAYASSITIPSGFTKENAALLAGIWNRLITRVARTEVIEVMTIGDLFNMARYIKGIADNVKRPANIKKDNDYLRYIMARESYLYLTNKLGMYLEKNIIFDTAIIESIKGCLPPHLKYSFNRDQYAIDAGRHRLVIDGVDIDIDPEITDEKTLMDKTGLVLTQETVKILGALIREQRFGHGVAILEGPTGVGKTFDTEAFGKLSSLRDVNGALVTRPFYCEPVHSSMKLERWLGYYKVDESGNYYFFDDTRLVQSLLRSLPNPSIQIINLPIIISA